MFRQAENIESFTFEWESYLNAKSRGNNSLFCNLSSSERCQAPADLREVSAGSPGTPEKLWIFIHDIVSFMIKYGHKHQGSAGEQERHRKERTCPYLSG